MSELREQLEAAYDAADTGTAEEAERQTGGPSKDSPEPVRDTPESQAQETTRTDSVDRERDDKGRFAPKSTGSLEEARADEEDSVEEPAEQEPTAEQETASEQEQPEEQQLSVNDKAPASWKPGVREHWSQLPPEVRQEVTRREHEAAQVMQQTAQARQVSSALQGLSQKYNAALSAEGVDILTATDNLAGIASRLRFGQPSEKAQTIANLISSYGVDIQMLDNTLAGAPAQPAAQSSQQFRDPRLDQMLAEQQRRQQEQQTTARQQAVREISEFASSHEFFDDVRDSMADLTEVAAKRGVDLTLQDAYDRAVALNPEISKIVAQRQRASSGQNQQRSTAKAKAAASSVKSSPVSGTTNPQGKRTVRGDILDAMESVNDR